jgi:hypothetical protein
VVEALFPWENARKEQPLRRRKVPMYFFIIEAFPFALKGNAKGFVSLPLRLTHRYQREESLSYV